MGRAGQQVLRDEDGLADRISVGLLARAFPRATVEAVVEAAKAREKRTRMLPSWLVVYYVLALALFMDMGGGRVMRGLAGTLSWAARGATVVLPSEEALSRARSRLGPVPLRLLFESAAGPLAGPDAPGGFWRGRRVLSVDGTTLDVRDTVANRARFGGPGTADESGAGLRGGFPKVRAVALAECGTRAPIAARQGGYATLEKALTVELLPLPGEGMPVLADRDFPGYDLWGQAAATGADLLWRVGPVFTLPVVTVLADGSRPSTLAPPKKERRAGPAPIVVRVVEYHLSAGDGTPTETFAPISALLDVEAAPAAGLADLHHARWRIENAFGAFKPRPEGDGAVLRSKTPDGAEQEPWALLRAYHAIRELIRAAAEPTGQDPLRLSFIAAPDAVRGPATTRPLSPLTGHPATSRPRGRISLPPHAIPAVPAGPTPARPNAATHTRASEPTGPYGHRHADLSLWSSYPPPSNEPKLKVLPPRPFPAPRTVTYGSKTASQGQFLTAREVEGKQGGGRAAGEPSIAALSGHTYSNT